MRSSSVFSSVRSSLAAATIAVVLTASAHAVPAPNRTTHRRDVIHTETGIERVIRVLQRFFAVTGQSEVISIPIPAPK